MTATRRPLGSGRWWNATAQSTTSATLVTSMMPVCLNIARQTARRPGERAGVRGGGPGALLAHAALPQDDGLAAADVARDLEEAAAVLDALHVGDDRPGLLVGAEVLEVVLGRQVALVAAAHDGAEAQALLGEEPDEVVDERAALREPAHGAGLPGDALHEHLRVGDHARRGVEEPDAVGADDARAALAADAPDLALELLALRAELAEAGGEHHGPLDLVGHALLDEVEDHAGRREQDGEVDLVRHGADARVGLDAEDLLALGVDRVDPAAAGVPQALEEEAPEAALLVAGADERHRLGVADARRAGRRSGTASAHSPRITRASTATAPSG